MNKEMFLKNQQAGQALIEALLALAFSVIIVTGVVIAVITSLSNVTFTKNQNLASSYAQEGLDIARNLKESNYQTFFSLSNGEYCATSGSTALTPGSCAVGSFTRGIYINHQGRDRGNVLKCPSVNGSGSFVASIVSWNDSKCQNALVKCHKVQLDSCYYDLNKIRNP